MDTVTLFVAGAIALHPDLSAAAYRDAAGVEAPQAIAAWQPLIAEASRRFGVPEAWIRAVMRAESDGRALIGGRPNTSPAGAIGLMQVMPETYAELRRRYGLGPDIADPRDNILAGTAYLRELYDRYGAPGFLAAYNAGPARFDDYRTRHRPLPAETRHYVATLGPRLAQADERPEALAPEAVRGADRVTAEPPLLREIRDVDRAHRDDEARRVGGGLFAVTWPHARSAAPDIDPGIGSSSGLFVPLGALGVRR
jgi:hypothetical protein